MQRKKSLKIVFATLALVLALSLVLSACTTSSSKFNYPDKPAQGAVESNGGVAVKYGDYVYFVNGNQSDYTVANEYTESTPVKKGNVARIKIADLNAILAMNTDATIASSDRTAKIQEAVYEKAEIVVPMVFFNASTSNKQLNGLYIFGDKLYFSSPNTAMTANGDVKNSELCVYSADLDGKNVKNLYTFTSNSQNYMLTEVGGKVIITYVENDNLYSQQLGAAANEIAKSVSSVNYDAQDAAVYYVKDGSICSYAAGAAEATTILQNPDKDNVTYTISQVNKGYVYYTMKDATQSSIEFGINAVKAGAESVKIFDNSTLPSGYSYLGYGEAIVATGKTFDSNPEAVQLFITSGDGSEKTYVLAASTNSSAITLTSIVGDVLTYTCNSKTYKVNLANAATYADDTTNEIYTTLTSGNWADIDEMNIGEIVYFTLNTSGNIVVNRYVEKDGAKSMETTSLQIVVPTED